MEKHKEEILAGEKTALEVMQEKGTIGEVFRKEKTASKLTMQQMSDRSGVAINTISNILSPDSKAPSFYNACAIAAILRVSIDQYMGINPMYDDRVADKVEHLQELLELYKANTRRWRNTVIALGITAGVLFLAFLIYLLVFDVPNPTYGIFRYPV